MAINNVVSDSMAEIPTSVHILNLLTAFYSKLVPLLLRLYLGMLIFHSDFCISRTGNDIRSSVSSLDILLYMPMAHTYLIGRKVFGIAQSNCSSPAPYCFS